MALHHCAGMSRMWSKSTLLTVQLVAGFEWSGRGAGRGECARVRLRVHWYTTLANRLVIRGSGLGGRGAGGARGRPRRRCGQPSHGSQTGMAAVKLRYKPRPGGIKRPSQVVSTTVCSGDVE